MPASVYVLARQASVKAPFGSSPVPRGCDSSVKAVFKVQTVGEGCDANAPSIKTRTGGGSSQTGALFPLWNQALKLDIAPGKNLSVRVEVEESWSASQDEEIRVCGACSMLIPRDLRDIYSGWLVLKNEHGGSEGQISVAISVSEQHIDQLKLGLTPVDESGRSVRIIDLKASCQEEFTEEFTEALNTGSCLSGDDWAEDMARTAEFAKMSWDELFKCLDSGKTGSFETSTKRNVPASNSDDWESVRLKNLKRNFFSQAFDGYSTIKDTVRTEDVPRDALTSRANRE